LDLRKAHSQVKSVKSHNGWSRFPDITKKKIFISYHDYKVLPKLIKHIFPAENLVLIRPLLSFSRLCHQIKDRRAGGDEKGLWRVSAMLVYFETHLCFDLDPLDYGQRTPNLRNTNKADYG
jgi:hypothetical protein